MRIGKYYPFAFIYFFINAVGLPFGMLYTILLTPLFYIWVIIKGKKQIILKFLFFSSPFIICHLINGVDTFQYFRSLTLVFTVYVFCYAFYTFITTYENLEGIFRKLLVTNFIFTLIALLFVFSQYRDFFWERGHWTSAAAYANYEIWPRLRMFTYEASYYSLLMVPIFAFYFMKFILKQTQKKAINALLMIGLPLVLSLSLGVISGIILSAGVLFMLNFHKFLSSRKLLNSMFILITAAGIGFIVLIIFYPDNPLFMRALNFFAGEDQSGRGRTTEAFYLSYKIAELKSIWWGVGFGQLKIIGDSVIRNFYNYPASITQVSIPNTFGETLALFGIVGIFLRMFTEIYLFFKTRVLDNYYRTFLFFFIFIYQFTGSFTTNIVEYVIWILAFTNCFPQFDKQAISKRASIQVTE